uniref:Uncharacterized protein n=1 Tax=Anguilla anguilla TaxID=7936 RepID=A0A0E9X4S5_ANGAN
MLNIRSLWQRLSRKTRMCAAVALMNCREESDIVLKYRLLYSLLSLSVVLSIKSLSTSVCWTNVYPNAMHICTHTNFYLPKIGTTAS